MPYFVDRMLSEEVSDAVQEAIVQKIGQKMAGAVGMLVAIVRAIEREYGPEGVEVARRGYYERVHKGTEESWAGVKDRSLATFCERLEKGCAGTHEWERIIDTEHAIGYKFTKCMWAEIFRSLDAADIGRWICDGDEIALKAYNPRLEFQRTKTLMDGDDFCDHTFTASP
ncbi:MAG: L-2-amino-thiazoline-4-carboxylic acid hydrolase [bacterium]